MNEIRKLTIFNHKFIRIRLYLFSNLSISELVKFVNWTGVHFKRQNMIILGFRILMNLKLDVRNAIIIYCPKSQIRVSI